MIFLFINYILLNIIILVRGQKMQRTFKKITERALEKERLNLGLDPTWYETSSSSAGCPAGSFLDAFNLIGPPQ